MDSIIKIDHVSDLTDILGIEKPRHPLVGLVDFSKANFQPAGGEKITSNFYIVMLKRLCPGTLRYGRNYYDFQEGTLLFFFPNQVITLENPDVTKDTNCWALFVHPELIRGTTLHAKIRSFNFFSYDVHEALHLSKLEEDKLSNIAKEIDHEINQNIDKHSKTLIISSIELLLNYCNRYYDRQFITRTESNKDIIADFENRLIDYFASEKLQNNGFPSVKDFAEQLHLSPNYFSDLLKKETGKNGTEHIQNYVIELAKDKLLGSTVSVSEIAYDLGFEYPQYFSKLFKKKTGISPAEYRHHS